METILWLHRPEMNRKWVKKIDFGSINGYEAENQAAVGVVDYLLDEHIFHDFKDRKWTGSA